MLNLKSKTKKEKKLKKKGKHLGVDKLCFKKKQIDVCWLRHELFFVYV